MSHVDISGAEPAPIGISGVESHTLAHGAWTLHSAMAGRPVLRPAAGVWAQGDSKGSCWGMVEKSLDSLVKQFADNVVAQNVCIRRGNARRGNQHARSYIRAWESLRARGDVGREALCALMADPRPDVREMAAVCLLRYRTDEALRVLRTLARGKGLVAFGAGEAIKRWNEGVWNLDPPGVPPATRTVRTPSSKKPSVKKKPAPKKKPVAATKPASKKPAPKKR